MINYKGNILISGIGTEVGKTMVSRSLCKHLSRDYWKPIQCGLEETDNQLMSEAGIRSYKEAYALKAPLSPHHAADLEQIEIDPGLIAVPEPENLIIEGAGGLLVPFNDKGYTFADFAHDHKLGIIIVSRHYLGSINHTLMTWEVMQARKLHCLGFIISGTEYPEAEDLYQTKGITILGRLPEGATQNTEIEWKIG